MQRREIEYKIDCPERIPFAVAWVHQKALMGLQSGKPVVVRLGRERRNLEQNARCWAMLSDLAKQVDWYGNRLSAEDWKHIISAGVLQQRTVPGIDGGVVILGQSTSKMSKKQFAEMIELMFALGAEKGVKWTDPKLAEEYREFVG